MSTNCAPTRQLSIAQGRVAARSDDTTPWETRSEADGALKGQFS